MAIKIKLNLPALNKIMTSPGAANLLRKEAQQRAAAAGEGFEAVVHPHKWTARAYVQTADDAGRRRQANEKVLERIITERS